MDSQDRFPVTGDLDRLLESLVRDEQRLAAAEVVDAPEAIGRYRVHRVVGRGGFGCVYLAYDEELQRPVAIKTPHRTSFATADEAEAYLKEARIVASLDHPAIVPVYDVGKTDEGVCYVVSKWLEGGDLSVLLATGRPSFLESSRILVRLAEALHYTHLRGLIHRDIKPANVLLDGTRLPYLTDFGLALKDDEKGGGGAGTPLYMSPEQARREGHRIDGRSDIFSLGVVYYELLTGRRPFRGDSVNEVLQEIIHVEARPPRSIDDSIPRELERIVLRTLSKRVGDRYQTAGDLAEELRGFVEAFSESAPSPRPSGVDPAETQRPDTVAAAHLKTTGVEVAPVSVAPKGLRSFDAGDAEFFWRLLPGPVDREGAPPAVRFWKSLLEERSEGLAAPVAVMYGPSGCGKSSLMRAGVEPWLDVSVHAVHVEARAGELEKSVRRRLTKAAAGAPRDCALAEIVAAVRRGEAGEAGAKYVLVIDQFEQWLHGWSGDGSDEFVAALRQCDGVRTQAVLLVRDDFWLALSRFMQQLEIRLVEGQNSALVDLFDLKHAERVLTEFGRAYGALPAAPAPLERLQERFVRESAEGLAEDGRVVCVRLALFAEMMKDRTWEPTTLRQMGGAEGVGFAFLEDTFEASHAPSRHRLHAAAARSVLGAMLPAAESDIKGAARSRSELARAARYEKKPEEFSSLIQLLDDELRLITPTDASAAEGEVSESTADLEPRYQLTHDYLVPSLRTWLQAKQRETAAGRAALRLEEYGELWRLGAGRRAPPGLGDYLAMLLRTDRRRWSGSQREMMRSTGRSYLLRTAALVVAVALVLGGVATWRSRAARRFGESLAEAVLAAEPSEVQQLVRQIDDEGVRRRANDVFRRVIGQPGADDEDVMAAACALYPSDASAGETLADLLVESKAGTRWIDVVQRSLATRSNESRGLLSGRVEHAEENPLGLLHLSAGLASVTSAEDAVWDGRMGPLAEALASADVVDADAWIDALEPVLPRMEKELRGELERASFESESTIEVDPWAALSGGASESGVEGRRRIATMALLRIYRSRGDAEGLVWLASAAPAADFGRVVDALNEADLRVALKAAYYAWAAKSRDEAADFAGDDRDERRAARWVLALHHLGESEELVDALSGGEDLTLQTAVLVEFGECLDTIDLPPLTANLLGALDPATTRGVLLLAGMRGNRDEVQRLTDAASGSADPGKLAAAGWGRRRVDLSMQAGSETAEGEMVFFAAPGNVTLGDPEGTPVLEEHEVLRSAVIESPFVIASRETTFVEFEEFWNDEGWRAEQVEAWSEEYAREREEALWDALQGRGADESFVSGPRDACPVFNISWYEAAEYCVWKSRREGLEECFELNDGKWRGKDSGLALGGYRLPTEAEWEVASRAGTKTLRFFGRGGEEAAARFAWFDGNSRGKLHACGLAAPNPRGLFDMYGNVMEWCWNDAPGEMPVLKGGSYAQQFEYIRSGHSFPAEAATRNPQVGFRLARTMSSAE